jgi:DNA-binding beta-propeller fold protein YncE
MPWGVTIDELGDVYVADWRNDRIQKFSHDGRFVFAFGSSGEGDGQFNRPSGVAVDLDGDIYVADWGNHRVQQFDATGRYVDKFIGDATISKIGRNYLMANQMSLRQREMVSQEPQKRLRAPQSVRVDAEGRMYIPDFGRHRVQIYKKEAYPLQPDQIWPVPRSPSLITA